jgi:hypothetical protein
VLLEIQSKPAKGNAADVAHGHGPPGRHYVVVSGWLLQHQPHGLHIVPRMAKVAPRL